MISIMPPSIWPFIFTAREVSNCISFKHKNINWNITSMLCREWPTGSHRLEIYSNIKAHKLKGIGHLPGTPMAAVKKKGASQRSSPAPGASCISAWLAGWGPAQSTLPCRAPPRLSAQMSPSPSLRRNPPHPKKCFKCLVLWDAQRKCCWWRRAPKQWDEPPQRCFREGEKASNNGSNIRPREVLSEWIQKSAPDVYSLNTWSTEEICCVPALKAAPISLFRVSCFLPHYTSPNSIPLSAGCFKKSVHKHNLSAS